MDRRRRLVYLCLTESCSVRVFSNADGNCRGCGERGFPVTPRNWWRKANGKPPP